MPLVRIDIMEGRPPEKIRELHSRVAALVAEILDTPIERVRTYITQFPPEGWGIGGVPADVALTAPSWAPVFGKIAATVTDVGGIMSHAAIVCREYGLPAVTGTAFGTKTIKTGQRVRVDGNAGTVTVID